MEYQTSPQIELWLGFCISIVKQECLERLVCQIYITWSCLDYKEGSDHAQLINKINKLKLITKPDAVREMAPGYNRNFLNLMKIYSQLDESWA